MPLSLVINQHLAETLASENATLAVRPCESVNSIILCPCDTYHADMTPLGFALHSAPADPSPPAIPPQESFNSKGRSVEAFEGERARWEEELDAMRAAMEAMAAERDGARKMAGAANERSGLLAAELVGLEEQLLKARAQHLKLERDVVRFSLWNHGTDIEMRVQRISLTALLLFDEVTGSDPYHVPCVRRARRSWQRTRQSSSAAASPPPQPTGRTCGTRSRL